MLLPQLPAHSTEASWAAMRVCDLGDDVCGTMLDAVCLLYFLYVGGYLSVHGLYGRCFILCVCVCEGVCFSYQQRGPGHPCRERPAEGPAAPCPCSL